MGKKIMSGNHISALEVPKVPKVTKFISDFRVRQDCFPWKIRGRQPSAFGVLQSGNFSMKWAKIAFSDTSFTCINDPTSRAWFLHKLSLVLQLAVPSLSISHA